jgi:hypothetical protein
MLMLFMSSTSNFSLVIPFFAQFFAHGRFFLFPAGDIDAQGLQIGDFILSPTSGRLAIGVFAQGVIKIWAAGLPHPVAVRAALQWHF